MADISVHTYYADGMWRNRIIGGEELFEDFVTRAEAVLVGRDHARELRVEHIVYQQDGNVLHQASYSAATTASEMSRA